MDDRQALTDTVLRYGRCIDDRDWDGLVAVHRRAAAAGGPLWTVGGACEFRLERAGGRWAIRGLTLRVAWVEGNQSVVSPA